MELIGEIVGYIAVVVSALIYQQKTKRKLVFFKATSDALWILHYVFIGGYTGAAVTGVALIREIAFFRSVKREKQEIFIFVCFLCASIICSALTWKNIFSIFAMAGSMMSVVSFWLGNPRVSRILAFPVSACMMFYGLSNGSRAVLINEILVMLSATLAFFRLDRKKAK